MDDRNLIREARELLVDLAATTASTDELGVRANGAIRLLADALETTLARETALKETLRMIAGMSATERNPDGDEQAAHSMQLVAQETLAALAHATGGEHPCPRGDDCALNKGAVRCFACGRYWPPDETWEKPAGLPVPADTIEKAREASERALTWLVPRDGEGGWIAPTPAALAREQLQFIAALAAVRAPEEQA